MTFSVMTIVTVTISMMAGLLLALGRIRKNLLADFTRHQTALAALDETA